MNVVETASVGRRPRRASRVERRSVGEIQRENSMRAYASAVESVVEKPGKPLCPKPVFRASAIFPALNRKGISTRICFLGYWMVKRSIPEVSAVITLRSESGKVLTRATRSIRACRAYCFELADQLMAAGIPADPEFVGSIEVEFFSARDLVFPYPAVIVNYYGPTFSTFVHTAQRIFNDVEEARDVMTTSVPESGFNIYSDDDLDPFFAFVNGFESVPDCRIMMEFHNYEGEVLQRELRPGDLGAYQTVMVHLKEVVDLHSFLKGRVGTAKIRYDAKWVYPRMVAGNWQRSLGALSITHTYYDCTEAKTAADYWMPAEAGWHPMSTAIPASISEDRFTNIYFYPIQSPSVVEIDLEVYTATARLLGKVPAAQRIESPSTGLHQISLKPICQQFGNCDGRDLAVKVIARAVNGSPLPTRIKLGLDLGLDDKHLPCNICQGLTPFTPAAQRQPA